MYCYFRPLEKKPLDIGKGCLYLEASTNGREWRVKDLCTYTLYFTSFTEAKLMYDKSDTYAKFVHYWNKIHDITDQWNKEIIYEGIKFTNDAGDVYLTEYIEPVIPDYTKGKSWSWALEKLLEGKKVRWMDWGHGSYLVTSDGYLERYSHIRSRCHYMGRYALSIEKMTVNKWELYEE